ncbi:DUF1569 domain-containing protein [Chitinophaga arvensicola]|uniref:DinB superfamily protein n=1 Tax=Chitinophaga arvensicola TaxID=29529 RepID=A0A1I0Q578_9BACT|nr:DUF1569 domain-containing protein [Chitinophaga arvensicola]SEW21951.1 Protein of unknown function [Chitinophaga arvensicola]
MKTIFDPAAREAFMGRINLLTKDHTAQWGKMSVYQMAKHCTIWNNWILGTKHGVYKQGLLGLIFGQWALKGIVKNDDPMKKNMPSGNAFLTKEKEGDLAFQKKTWIEQVSQYEHFSNPAFIHDFFGKMDTDEIGILVYKHFDHHLRQFNV